MKTEQEKIDYAEAMINAYKAGKKLLFNLPSGGQEKYDVKDFDLLLRALGNSAEITIAPEPKELWVVVCKDGHRAIFPRKKSAEDSCIKWDNTYPKLAPHKAVLYRPVMP